MSVGSPNETNLENLMQLGINAARNRNKEAAKGIFTQVLNIDRRNERAWLWLAAVEDDQTERRRILQTVLSINPENQKARELLEAMDRVIERSERASMELGIRLIIILVIVLIVVGILVYFITA
ncbi:MAG: hypothetical protein CUN49_04200 [Candidatus Thermofonsia Clade 1 bacterium]|uniref:Tetratricopeptide repeat protein n=1 Tax=Candidatus Thermofonsia Clade 1 bacterium TaxID=2364210 RepID=A0A2M8PYZ8_9CHLR|nr:MAG: hypothetical protein CUN49_04200 [Candidatus Thermofonsia Clade 1 bacterium]PJF42753.1 MAG: hypothetical protein CUN50_02835 [Candidatus Thermofonsia Clade 1 bacterium]RMF48991.1 MAG: hypothetical protein D6749_14260 [Chloroflexota bacterium]